MSGPAMHVMEALHARHALTSVHAQQLSECFRSPDQIWKNLGYWTSGPNVRPTLARPLRKPRPGSYPFVATSACKQLPPYSSMRCLGNNLTRPNLRSGCIKARGHPIRLITRAGFCRRVRPLGPFSLWENCMPHIPTGLLMHVRVEHRPPGRPSGPWPQQQPLPRSPQLRRSRHGPRPPSWAASAPTRPRSPCTGGSWATGLGAVAPLPSVHRALHLHLLHNTVHHGPSPDPGRAHACLQAVRRAQASLAPGRGRPHGHPGVLPDALVPVLPP